MIQPEIDNRWSNPTNMMMKGPEPRYREGQLPFMQQPRATNEKFTLEEQRVPMWANLLYQGVGNRHQIKDTLKKWKEDPSLAEPVIQGLLGQHLLSKVLPSNMRADLKNKSLDWNINDRLSLGLSEDDKSLNYRATDNLDVGFGKRGDTNFLNLGWRF